MKMTNKQGIESEICAKQRTRNDAKNIEQTVINSKLCFFVPLIYTPRKIIFFRALIIV